MEQKSEVIYGKNPVTELLKSKAGVDTVFISESLNPSVQNYYTALAKECGAVVKKVHPMKLKSLCQSENHQGVAAYASTIEYVSLGQIVKIARDKGEAPFVVVCDGIEDPHNLGAIMRSAYLMGAHGIVIPKRGGVSVTGVVHKTSAGASMHMPVAKVANIAQAVRALKEENIFVYAADLNDTPIYKQNLTGPIALVVGSEGKGVQPLVKSLCDDVVSIPMNNEGGAVDSYNASVAAGIIMYEISRQRTLSTK
ncbi:MAG: 23S rRNA (guanosine(2251)-2'-O)-methyltransferase RlmB [Oscillospiraceae bacterium]|nr:23S rRNA (guanosine(2251)-2'-O)-methyltransferase RlmB [Oscillospiraceae bacterium]MBQ5314273.1 23S rRNA (guanosine(2251)-2'-O)-methyltransferase RlmB [Oscillospiraceae bacterium]MBQ5324978.1 23S rRNA (guanosine(2251)-2'-O)-methyltransferase RlmB [Oscillospiraceae bacterium]